MLKYEMIFCKCGCGETRFHYDKRGRKREYIKGYHSRVHGNHLKSKDHYRWNASLFSKDGYKLIRVGRTHPLDCPNGYVKEHTIIWISAGKELKKGFVLHHKNGDRTDNRIENLEMMTIGDHNRTHNKSKSRDKKGRFLARKWDQFPEV